MKYAVIGPQGGVNRITNTQPTAVAENATVREITDEQAALIEAGRAAKVFYVFDGDGLVTQAERRARIVAARPKPVPREVPLWAFRAALADAGLLASAQTVVAAVNSTDLTAFFEYGNFVERASPSLAQLAAQLTQTSAQVDALFIAAAAKKL